MLVLPSPPARTLAHRPEVAYGPTAAVPAPTPMGWSPGARAPDLTGLCLEDLLVAVFGRILESEARGIAADASAVARAAEAYALSGDMSALEGQEITEARLALRERMKDREHLFSMVLAVLDSLGESAKRALESLGK